MENNIIVIGKDHEEDAFLLVKLLLKNEYSVIVTLDECSYIIEYEQMPEWSGKIPKFVEE